MKSVILILTILCTFNVYASVKERVVPDLNKLKLNQEAFLTDSQGIINVKAVSILQVGDSIKLFRTDGTLYTGRVVTTEESEGILRIMGVMNNAENTEFGFVLAKGGIFAGAIVDKKNSKTYAIELSEPHKGFIFLLTNKYDKPVA
jgi:hypothetical protein